MSRSLSWLPIVLVVVALLPLAVSAYPPPKPPPKPTPAEIEAQKKLAEEQKQAREALKAQEVYLLKSSFFLLAEAKNNYEGHKGKAMGAVEAALNILDPEGMKQVKSQVHALEKLEKEARNELLHKLIDSADMMQAISDAQVHNAATTLSQVAELAAANKHPKVLEHVQFAVKELNDAPKHPFTVKGKEQEVLTSAYILLASADHDYDGHRARAMGYIQKASNILEVDVLKREKVQEKIKVLKEANVVAQTNLKAQEDVALPAQTVADTQLRMANALIHQVTVSLKASKRHDILEQVVAAHKEIETALTVR
jgi:hypothetical protein